MTPERLLSRLVPTLKPFKPLKRLEILSISFSYCQIRKTSPSRRHSSMRPQDVKSADRVKKVTRSIPNEIKRSVWQRDQGCCQFRDPVTNKVCGSTFQLEYEPIRPWSFNGEHSVENIVIMFIIISFVGKTSSA